MKGEEVSILQKLGFIVPTEKSMDKVKKISLDLDLFRAEKL